MITVYTQPSCVQCTATKRYLTQNEAKFTEVDLLEDPEALEMVKSLGYTQAPVVISGNDHWSGFNPEKLLAALG